MRLFPVRCRRQSASHLFRPSHLAIATTALTAALSGTARAQPVEAPAAESGSPAEPAPQGVAGPIAPRNGYAEVLRPSVKRSAAQMRRPYEPIGKPDDQSQIPELEMFVGETRVFPAPGVARIAVGNGQIMNAAALDNKEVIVFANGVGTSSLFIWNADGRYQRVKINIIAGDTTRYSREIAAFLSSIPNTRASVIGNKVIVEGDNLSDLDLAKVEELAKRYPQIVNFTNRLGWEQMVLMDVKVVEFPINQLRELGLKWTAAGGAAIGAIWAPIRGGNNPNFQINLPSGVQAPISPTPGALAGVVPSGLQVLSLLNLGLNAQLNLLEQNGIATILAEPQLSARNGAKASFLAGGEYPYTVSTINGTTVVFKPFGVKLEIEPQVDRNGVIRAKILSEVSSIDGSVTTLAGPALSTRRTNTEFNVRNGETLVLSGLLSRRTSTTIDKVPFLGDLPILGALFRSKRFQNDETELVVFVTPTVIDSRSPGLVDRIDRATDRMRRNFGREEPFLSNPLQPGHDPARPNVLPPPPPLAPPPSLPPRYGPAPIATAGPEDGYQPVITPVAAAGPAEPVVLTSKPAAAPVAAEGSDRGATLLVLRDGVVLRAEPTDASAALLPLARGAAVRMTEVAPSRSGATTWRHVHVGELRGWVPAAAVEPARLRPALAPADAALPSPRAATGGSARAITANAPDPNQSLERRRVSARQLVLRLSPDVNAPMVARLTQGDLVEVLPQSPEGNWVAVQTEGRRGWVPAQWLVPSP